MTPRNPMIIAATALLLALLLSSCGGAVEDEASSVPEDGSRSGSSGSSAEQSMMMESSGMGGMETTMADGSEVTVGGFTVEAPNGEEITVPEISVRQEEARAYLDDVQPIVEDSVRDISGLVEPEVAIENGNISLDLNVNSLDEARQSIESSAQRLREIQPPDGLEGVNDELVRAYEDAAPAYQDVVDAARSGDAQEIADVVQQSLGDIERFNEQVDALLQDVQQAAEEPQ